MEVPSCHLNAEHFSLRYHRNIKLKSKGSVIGVDLVESGIFHRLPDGGCSDEELEGVVLVDVDLAVLDLLLELLHLLLPVAGEVQLLLEAPQDARAGANRRLRQHVEARCRRSCRPAAYRAHHGLMRPAPRRRSGLASLASRGHRDGQEQSQRQCFHEH